jgi:hypothetical protein
MDLLKLVKNKNICLMSLLECSEQFYVHAQKDSLTMYATYEKKRGRLFKVLSAYDRLIDQCATELHLTQLDEHLSIQLRQLMDLQAKVTASLLSLNEKIMNTLEAQKNKLSHELGKSDQQRNLLSKFRSTWIPESGAELDGTV